MFKTIFMFVVVAFSMTEMIAQGTPEKVTSIVPPQTKAASQVSEYQQLLDKLKGGDTNINFATFRLKYTETDAYSAMGTPAGQRNSMFELLSQDKFSQARDLALEVLTKNYTDSNAHMVAAIAFQELGDKTKSDFHRAVYLGLIKSIESSGDGRSPKTAYIVISVPEEYALLSYMDLQRDKQALIQDGGSKYDVLTVRPRNGGEAFDLYFNVDIVFKGYEKIFQR